MSATKVCLLFKPADPLREFLQAGLAHRTDIELRIPAETEAVKLAHLLSDAQIAIGWRPTAEMLDSAPALRMLINPGAGVQHHFDGLSDIYLQRGIRLLNCHGNAWFTAQHSVAMLLAMMTRLFPHDKWMRQGKWRLGDKEAATIPLRGMQVGLAGYGHVNRNVHRMLSGFSCDFHVLRRRADSAQADLESVNRIYGSEELNPFLQAIDVLMLAVPMTPATEGMIGKRELELLGRDAFLVNVARGAVIDEEALYTALKEEKLAGAALDVWYEYQPEEDGAGRKRPHSHPFHELENVIMSPHRAASPYADLARWKPILRNIEAFADGATEFSDEIDLEARY